MNSQVTFTKRIARALLPRKVRSAYGRLLWRWWNWLLWDFSVSPNFTFFLLLYWYFHWIRRRPVIAVYQPGRVGSTAVTVAICIAQAGLTFHLHSLAPDQGQLFEGRGIAITPAIARYLRENDRVARCLRWVLGRKARVKIIVLLRDPVAHSISSFFYNFYHITGHSLDEKAWTIAELRRLYWVTNTVSGYTSFETWFNQELHRYTGVDVFAEAFDAERGWQVYTTGRLSVLAIKTELDDARKSSIIGEFLAIKNLPLQVRNSAEEQSYRDLFRAFSKNFSLTPERLDRI